jgi:hypothetical protein
MPRSQEPLFLACLEVIVVLEEALGYGRDKAGAKAFRGKARSAFRKAKFFADSDLIGLRRLFEFGDTLLCFLILQFQCRIELLLEAMCDQCLAVEMQQLEMIRTALRESFKRSVLLFTIMLCHRVEKWMKKAHIRRGLPVIALKFVASVAAIDKIIERIVSPMNARQKMINSHFRAQAGFADATITAAKIIALPHRLTQGLSH